MRVEVPRQPDDEGHEAPLVVEKDTFGAPHVCVGSARIFDADGREEEREIVRKQPLGGLHSRETSVR